MPIDGRPGPNYDNDGENYDENFDGTDDESDDEISRQLLVTESENLQWVSLSQGLGVVLGMLETFKNNKYENLPPIPGPRGWGGWDFLRFLLKILLEMKYKTPQPNIRRGLGAIREQFQN